MTQTQKASWAAFFSRERKRLVNYVRTLIDDAADRESEDIVQDVVLGIFDKADILAPIENFSAYVYQALRNRVVDKMRSRKKHESIDGELPGDTGLVLADILTDVKFDVAGESERLEIKDDLSRAVEMLDERDQLVFIETEINGMSFRELSEEWQVPIGTLLARKSRAMKKLREALLKIDPVHYSCLV